MSGTRFNDLVYVESCDTLLTLSIYSKWGYLFDDMVSDDDEGGGDDGRYEVWDEATESEDDEEEWAWATYDMAPDLAASLSLCPRDIIPTTPCCGTGVLAHTPPPAPLPDPA